MTQTCATVRVKADNAHGYAVINESDLDVKTHEIFEPEDKKLTVTELKEALTAKGIEIPEGAKKAELVALLG